MQHARSVTGPLRRAHPASGATWNVQVVRGKMSSRCLWHACRALSVGLLLMLLGAAMATIGYYADTLSVAQEVRGNATVSVKDETRGFHLNNLSYAGPIVMGFGGFIVVAACVMTFEARDSAAKVTPARPGPAAPRPMARLGASAVGGARWDQLGVYRLPALPLLPPLPHAHSHRRSHARFRVGGGGAPGAGAGRTRTAASGAVGVAAAARCGSAPDLRCAARAGAAPMSALRRPLRRYALSVDEAPRSTHSASAAESECGSQSSLALDLHAPAGGGARGVTLRVRDSTRRRPPPLARQPRLRDDTLQATVAFLEVKSTPTATRSSCTLHEESTAETAVSSGGLAAGGRPVARASSAPPPETPPVSAPECPPAPPPPLPGLKYEGEVVASSSTVHPSLLPPSTDHKVVIYDPNPEPPYPPPPDPPPLPRSSPCDHIEVVLGGGVTETPPVGCAGRHA